jgi:hypothetical protein
MDQNSYVISIFVTCTGMVSFIVEYSIKEFNTRLLMFTYFDGLTGIFYPLMSSLKSQMIPEKLRSTIMNFFRVPINIFAILSFILSKFITTYQICLIAVFFMFISTVTNGFLLYFFHPPDKHHRKIQKISEISQKPN